MTKPTEFKSSIIPIIQKLNFNYQYLSDPHAYNFKELENAILESQSLLFKLNKKLEEKDYDQRELLQTVSSARELSTDFESYLDEADKALNSKLNKANKIDENFMQLNLNLQQLHSEWKQTIADSNVNISKLKNKINVVNLQTSSQLKEAETNYNSHLKEVEKQYKDYCIKIKNDQNDYIQSIRNNSNKEIENIRNEIIDWETKLRESRSNWKTLKTQIETMKKNKEQI